MTLPNEVLPFYEGSEGVPAELFAGRRNLRKAFEIEMLRKSRPTAPVEKRLVWMVEGGRGAGKTSFGDWISDQANATIVTDRRVALVRYKFEDDMESIGYGHELLKTTWKALRQHLRGSWYRSCLFWMRRAYSFLSTGKYPFIGQLPSIKSARMVEATYVRWLAGLLRHSVYGLAGVVVVLDEIGKFPQAVEFSCRLAAEFQEKHLRDCPVNLGLILLVLPTWNCELPEGLDPGRHLSKPTELLSPFDFEDVTDLVAQALSKAIPRWTAAPGVSGELLKLSGGQPQVLQALGHAAAKRALRKDAKSRQLEITHVQEALAEDAAVEAAIVGVLRPNFKMAVPNGFQSENELRVVDFLTDPDMVNQDESWAGLERAKWKAKCSVTKELNHAFETVWPKLEKCGLLTPVEKGSSTIRFSGTALRSQFRRCYRDW